LFSHLQYFLPPLNPKNQKKKVYPDCPYDKSSIKIEKVGNVSAMVLREEHHSQQKILPNILPFVQEFSDFEGNRIHIS
jgi:hypothetical protein